MNTVYTLSIGAALKGSSVLSIHATEAGALGALNRYIVQHPGGPAWKLTGTRLWRSGSNFLLIEPTTLEA